MKQVTSGVTIKTNRERAKRKTKESIYNGSNGIHWNGMYRILTAYSYLSAWNFNYIVSVCVCGGLELIFMCVTQNKFTLFCFSCAMANICRIKKNEVIWQIMFTHFTQQQKRFNCTSLILSQLAVSEVRRRSIKTDSIDSWSAGFYVWGKASRILIYSHRFGSFLSKTSFTSKI